jgi:hypothetical protein
VEAPAFHLVLLNYFSDFLVVVNPYTCIFFHVIHLGIVN